MTQPARASSGKAAHGKKADRRRLLAIGAGGLLALLLVVYLRSRSSTGTSATSGYYTDAAGNVYDANGNLVQAAPSSTSADTGTGYDTGAYSGGTGLSSGGIPNTTDLSGTGGTGAGAVDLSGLVTALEALAGGGGAAGGGDPTLTDPFGGANPGGPEIPAAQPPATTGGGGGAGAAAASNVRSVVKLANGATLTTLTTGRQIEQAPGKTPYVVRSGDGTATPEAPPHVAASTSPAHAAAPPAPAATTSAPGTAQLAKPTQKLITTGEQQQKVLVHGAVE